LLIDGIKSIAHQLCELPYKEIVIDNKKPKKKIKNYLDISDKTWSIEAGFATKRGLNLLNVSKEVKLNKYLNLSTSVGFPCIYFGTLSESNYNNNGLVFGIYAGWGYITLDNTGIFTTSLAYQWRITKQMLIAIGITSGFATYNKEIVNSNYRGKSTVEFEQAVRGPVLSLEYKL